MASPLDAAELDALLGRTGAHARAGALNLVALAATCFQGGHDPAPGTLRRQAGPPAPPGRRRRVVDAVAVDVRTGALPVDAVSWQQHLDDVEPDGSPRDLAAWLAFAARHHAPLAISRWGLDPGQGASDRVLYDVFVNYPVGSDTRLQITDPRNAAAVYRSLT